LGSTGTDGPIIACLLATLAAAPGALGAQAREERHYSAGSPEAKLMLYYSSTVAFSSLGMAGGAVRWRAGDRGTRVPTRFEAAVELSYLPPLSEEQRTTGSDKPEATNLAPVFARPRVTARLPGDAALELSWIPPVRVFDVKANLFAAAVSRPFAVTSTMRLVPRVAFLTGRVEGPITCNRDTANDSADLATYYAFVCYGNDSRDFFEPRHVSGEVLVTRATAGRWQPYLSAGARSERTRFDIGVIRRDGAREIDHPVLEVKATRAYGTLGASWFGVPRARLAAELYYAPGSVLTVRGLAGVRLW
jgi:hypothetical protein